jgi:tetratricopeptide (TPR) repeat protein
MHIGGCSLRRSLGLVVLIALAVCVPGIVPSLAAQTVDDSARIVDRLIQRVRDRPDDASAWRMLGRIALEQQLLDDAAAFLEQSLSLDNLSAAAWFDMARTHQAQQQTAQAMEAYARVLDLAPDSEYAATALQTLETLQAAQPIQLTDYEIRQFNGLEHIDEQPMAEELAKATGPDRLRLQLETGILFDSNVALSPISRSLAPGNTESGQIFLASYLEYRLFEGNNWRSGPRAAGNFTWNESDFSNFNLQSYRPGWFLARDFFGETLVSSLRIDYEFAHDEFQQTTFGNRHALTTAGTIFWDEGRATSVYWASDYTNFANDGIDPSVTSLDGWTNALGMFQEWGFRSPWISLLRLGGQVERADTTGSDNLYNGIGLNAEIVIPLAQRTDGTLSGSWGIRDYPEFESGIARDETLWSAAAQIRHRLNNAFAVRGVVSFDRFVSDNPLYDAQRLLAGVVLIYQR